MADVTPAIDQPPTFLQTVRVMFPIVAVWAATFFIGYLLSFDLLSLAMLPIFGGFPISTFMFYNRRQRVSKSLIKALDYVTVLTFVTGIIAVAEIDTKTYKDRADDAAVRIANIQQDAQGLLDAQLQNCPAVRIEPPYTADHLQNYVSLVFVRELLFCFVFSDLRREDLAKLPMEALDKRLMYTTFGLFLVPTDKETRAATEAFREYTRTRRLIVQPNPIGTFIPKTLAYLLVAFAFSVRLTRTTVEVFEWHRR